MMATSMSTTATVDAQLSSVHIYDLPNEVLISILKPFSTHELLPLTRVSHCFHNLVLRMLHFRLLLAAESPEYKIILEAYLPSRGRWTRPYLFCTYLGTNGLSSKIRGVGSLYHDDSNKDSGSSGQEDNCIDKGKNRLQGRLGKLSGLYSRFRPEYPAEQGKMPVRRIAGAAPNLQSSSSSNQDWYIADSEGRDPQSFRTLVADAFMNTGGPTGAHTGQVEGVAVQQPPTTQPIFGNRGDGGSRPVIYTLNFDADELFGQFCSSANLVKLGPRRGVFLSTVPLVEDKQGVIRVWREWLLDRAKMLIETELGGRMNILQRTPTDMRPEDVVKDKNILWTDHRKNFGLKMAIRERPISGVRIRGFDENKDDIPLSFDIEIQELIVRTTRLLLAVEDSQKLAHAPGKALIFGSFAVAAQ